MICVPLKLTGIEALFDVRDLAIVNLNEPRLLTELMEMTENLDNGKWSFEPTSYIEENGNSRLTYIAGLTKNGETLGRKFRKCDVLLVAC